MACSHRLALAFPTTLFLALFLSGCGSSESRNPFASSPLLEPVSPASSLRGKWQLSDDGQTVLDFSNLGVGEERSSEEVLYTCDHYTWGYRVRDYTNSGTSPATELRDLTPGAQQGIYKVLGDESRGEIQFGYLKNSRFTNDICRILSSERYTFSVTPDTLTLILQAPGKPYDGAVTTATRVTE